MTTYKEIFGKPIKVLSSDPTDAGAEGQVWYNSTAGAFKTVLNVGSWSSGGSMGTARYNMTGTGTQNAALGAGGYLPGLSPFAGAKNTEEYDGSSWTNSGNMNQGKHEAGCFAGSQTSAIIASGYAGTANLSSSESYNGSSWTNTPSLNVARRATYQGMGSKAAAVCIGGTVSTAVSNVEEWNDISWTSVTALPTVRRSGGSSGTQTAGIIFGGQIPPNTTTSFEYDGTNWTSGGALPTAISGMQPTNGPQGTQTAAGSFSGSDGTSPVTSSFTYNGTSWSTIESVSTARAFGGGAGSTTAGLIFGGAIPSASPARSNATEEFNVSIYSPIAATWASGGALPGIRWNTSGAGTATAGLVFGGSTGPATPTFLNTTFEYDGSSWTGGGNFPNSTINKFGAGTQTAAIGGGGYNSGNSTTAATYNGSTWTNITATPFGTKGAGCAGTSTAALIYGSDVSPSDNQDSYSWNGSSWAEEGALNNTFQNGASGGPSENTAFAAGSEYSPASSTRFETYNGTAWSNGAAMGTAQYQNRGFGSSAECLSIGGYNKITTVQKFDGTSWAATASLGTGRKQFGSANFTSPGISNGFVAGGADGDASVETFTDEVVQLGYKTLTSS